MKLSVTWIDIVISVVIQEPTGSETASSAWSSQLWRDGLHWPCADDVRGEGGDWRRWGDVGILGDGGACQWCVDQVTIRRVQKIYDTSENDFDTLNRCHSTKCCLNRLFHRGILSLTLKSGASCESLELLPAENCVASRSCIVLSLSREFLSLEITLN